MVSRYTDARRAWVPHKTQGMVEIVYRKPPVYQRQPYADQLSKASDSMQSLAWDAYHDPTLWWQIADLNPGIIHPDDLTFGLLLHVPTIVT